MDEGKLHLSYDHVEDPCQMLFMEVFPDVIVPKDCRMHKKYFQKIQ